MTSTPSQADPSPDAMPDVSIVVPLYDEQENAASCYEDIRTAMGETGLEYELVFVDDGSTDETLEVLRSAVRGDERVRVVELRRNFGQAAAFAAGFDRARAPVVVPMDGDLQNDPRDIPMLVEKLGEPPGYDVVSGWRRNRQDPLLRRLFSRTANWLISTMTGVRLHDYGCSLKAYRREVLEDIRLYGEMHRFIPALIHWVGGRVTEVVVNHRPRRAGNSKYGLGRTFRVLLDLVTVEFMMKYLTKPLYFFGKIGLATLLMAFAVLGAVIAQKLGHGTDMTGNPLLYLSVAFLIISVQILLMGLIMEVLTRTYHESQGRKTYTIRAVYPGGRKPGERASPPAADPSEGSD
ncbi:MAG: glycosyltransferase family 2 protein [Candidatus Brocadiaceae bacterium]|jgi:glycosyltransferase involved in cell wall biosynthesis